MDISKIPRWNPQHNKELSYSSPSPPPNPVGDDLRPSTSSSNRSRPLSWRSRSPSHIERLTPLKTFTSSLARGGYPSPRKHGFSPREHKVLESGGSAVETVVEEGTVEAKEEKENEIEEEHHEYQQGFGANSPAKNTKGLPMRSQDEWKSVPTVEGVGILPEPPPSVPNYPSGSESDRSLNKPRLSATGSGGLAKDFTDTPLNDIPQEPTGSNQERGTWLSDPSSPDVHIDPAQLSPLPSPPLAWKRNSKSRLASIAPSLAEELAKDKEYIYSITPSTLSYGRRSSEDGNRRRGSHGTGKDKGSKDIMGPQVSSFSTDTSSEDEDGDGANEHKRADEKHSKEANQASSLPITAIPGKFVNLVEIGGGSATESGSGNWVKASNDRLGRRRGGSVKRKESVKCPAYQPEQQPQQASQPASPSIVSTETPKTLRDQPKTSRRYTGYAIRLNNGVYVPLKSPRPPQSVDVSHIYNIKPLFDADDDEGTSIGAPQLHILSPYRPKSENEEEEVTEKLFIYDNTVLGFLPVTPAATAVDTNQNEGSTLPNDFQCPSQLQPLPLPIYSDDQQGLLTTATGEEHSTAIGDNGEGRVQGNDQINTCNDLPQNTGAKGSQKRHKGVRLSPGSLDVLQRDIIFAISGKQSPITQQQPRLSPRPLRRKEANILGLGRGTRKIGPHAVTSTDYPTSHTRGLSVDSGSKELLTGGWDFDGIPSREEENLNLGLMEGGWLSGKCLGGKRDIVIQRDVDVQFEVRNQRDGNDTKPRTVVNVRTESGSIKRQDPYDNGIEEGQHHSSANPVDDESETDKEEQHARKMSIKMGDSWLNLGKLPMTSTASPNQMLPENPGVHPALLSPSSIYEMATRDSNEWPRGSGEIVGDERHISGFTDESNICQPPSSHSPTSLNWGISTPLLSQQEDPHPHPNPTTSEPTSAFTNPAVLASQYPDTRSHTHANSCKLRRHYGIVTVNLQVSKHAPARVSRITVPLGATSSSPDISEGNGTSSMLDDEELFSRVRKEYEALRGGWRRWMGLRGVKWAGISEHLDPPIHKPSNLKKNALRKPHRWTTTHPRRPGAHPAHLPPSSSSTPHLLQYFYSPRKARGKSHYMGILRTTSLSNSKSHFYSIDLVEDWIVWKCILVGIAPVVAGIVATVIWWYLAPRGGGNGGEGKLLAFQVGLMVDVLGFGVVGVLALLS